MGSPERESERGLAGLANAVGECEYISDAKMKVLEKNAYKEEMLEGTMNTPISLKKSVLNIGQLYPILKDADGKVIDGFHRLEVNPAWKSITLENVKTEEERLIVSAHANIGRRNVTRKERMDVINRLAEIYYAQGLRPDAKIITTGKNGRTQKRNYNEIKHKIAEVMNGVMSPTQIRYYLDSKYLYQAVAEGNKKHHAERKKNTPAYELLLGSHGKQLRGVYGSSFFYRLENEMIAKAKVELRESSSFIHGVKRELRKDMIDSIIPDLKLKIRLEIREEIKDEIYQEIATSIRKNILIEYKLMDNIPDWANSEKIIKDVAELGIKQTKDKKVMARKIEV